jgi:hydroxyethylthiazole kinase-like uncharacterized protein yjeF
MQTLPLKLYRAAQVRELDRIAIERHSIPGLELMRRAGQAAFVSLRRRWPEARRIAVFCGAGNNGGDGYVVARLALQAGLETTVYALADPEQLHGDALQAYRDYQKQGGTVRPFAVSMQCAADIVIDALLGTGLDRPVEGLLAAAIAAINALQKPAIALDIPSGLHADTGTVMGCALRADCTVTFIALKQGLFTGDAADYCGEVDFASLQVPETVYQDVPHAALRLAKPHFPPRGRTAHKGQHGHVLVIGGDSGYSGAARMAAQAAARVGTGLVSIASREKYAPLLNVAYPELMCHGVETAGQLGALLVKADIVVIGPGLGQSAWALELLQAASSGSKPLVVDADGLNLLARTSLRHGNWVLTPHPGEAARLLDCSVREVLQDRFAAAKAIQEKYCAVCVLKGAGTLIVDGREVYINGTGNPGMASGGMGDVLSGAIAGLVAQGYAMDEAARLGVYIHGAAADLAAVDGERGMLASDLLPHLRKLVNA